MILKPGQVIDKFTAKNNKRVTLRTPKLKDLDQLLNFINSLVKEDTFILATKKKTRKEERIWLKNLLKDMKDGKKLGLVAEVNGKIVGSSTIESITERSPHVGNAGMAILKPYRNIGIGSKMMQKLIGIGKEMKFKFLFFGVFGGNKAGIKLYKKFGFKEVARLPKFFSYKGKYIDDVLMMKKL